MSGAARGPGLLLWVALAALLLLHNDFWLWDAGGRLLGLPVGLTYHLGYTLLTAVVLAWLVRRAWPEPRSPQRPRR